MTPKVNNDKFWCSTEVDENGNFKNSGDEFWGNCDDNCQREEEEKIFEELLNKKICTAQYCCTSDHKCAENQGKYDQIF